ncbi:PHD-zinc-finger like domain-containing protein [Pholiota molesta]|nr:PHD-zinc-finger like domain-containing protein [Pholiota molesta]
MSNPVYLKNGDLVKVNDHVYCSPSWDSRDGTPYSVARIMEFLPPEDAPKGEESKKYHYTRVRLAWYYRPSDVSDRPVADPLCDINQLRAKCHVVHRDKISDLSGWKKRPDRFYFNRLFDPYIKKEFEVIPSHDVRNLPDHIRDKEVIPDLTDTIRLCDTCHDWCPSADSVLCDRCKKYFHMRCVQPPLMAKPSRGYGWTCAPCSRKHEEENKSNAPAARGRGRPRKDKSLAEREENLPVKHFNMWPFRYFGQHTVAEDTLANVPPAPDPYNVPSEIEERGGDNTVEVLGIFNTFTESEPEEIKNRLSNDPKQKSSVDWLTEVIHRLSEAAMEGSMSNVKIMLNRLDKWKKQETPYTDKEWSREEHGAELRAVRDEVASRSIYEVVRFYGHWKKNAPTKEAGPPPAPIRAQYKSLAEASSGQHVGHSDDEASIIAQPSKTPSCGACRTRESKTWWKAPKVCGSNVRPLREESVPTAKIREKREGTPLAGPSTKRPRTSTSVQSTPPPTISIAAQNRCLGCLKTGPPGKVLKCKQCGFRVHAGTIGVHVDPSAVDAWVCELCENEETLEASINPDCLLCPRASNEDKRRKPWPPHDSFLRACKPTESQGWAHILCAVFTPELTFTDASRLRLVEGLNTVARHKWQTKCCLCGEQEGAVIRCSDCSKEFHASCAWKQGHRFGFEIQPVKSSRRDTTITTTFKGETGCMNAIVSCKDHDHSKRDIYDICETNEGGETALQVYCQAYKQAPTTQAHGLLRKARRLDTILNIRSDIQPPVQTPTTAPDPECFRCHSQFSPAFYPVTETSLALNGHRNGQEVWMCHKCHFDVNETSSAKSMGMMVS